MFLHGDILHLLGNMLFLWVFGDNVEDKLGKKRFIGLYLFSGVIAVFAHYLLNIGSAIPVIGASGAISGILGAYVVMFFNRKIRVLAVVAFVPINCKVQVAIFAALFLAYQLYLFFMDTFVGTTGVAFFAHIWGLFAGIFFAVFLTDIEIEGTEAEEGRKEFLGLNVSDEVYFMVYEYVAKKYGAKKAVEMRVENVSKGKDGWQIKIRIGKEQHSFAIDNDKFFITEKNCKQPKKAAL
ncbi:MAG: rhomboid family intramembrane serine protease [Candidatus Diapherotrites archaeon]|nr:rhomboid family intramembrane serine protease [Candidatus Diapherotrites archaeon]